MFFFLFVPHFDLHQVLQYGLITTFFQLPIMIDYSYKIIPAILDSVFTCGTVKLFFFYFGTYKFIEVGDSIVLLLYQRCFHHIFSHIVIIGWFKQQCKINSSLAYEVF
jgi:hypothetical protein